MVRTIVYRHAGEAWTLPDDVLSFLSGASAMAATKGSRMKPQCRAANCGRVHGLDYLFRAFADARFCAYHRAELELGTYVECRDGETAWYTDDAGLILLPPNQDPRIRKDDTR